MARRSRPAEDLLLLLLCHEHLAFDAMMDDDDDDDDCAPRSPPAETSPSPSPSPSPSGVACARECLALFLQRQEWPHCRPLKHYAQTLSSSPSPSPLPSTISLHGLWERPSKLLKLHSRSCSDQSQPSNYLQSNSTCSLAHARRRCVQWIIQASEAMNADVAATCQAAAYLDRFLANQVEIGIILDVHVAGAACLWIATKMDGGDAPSAESLARMMGESVATLEAMEARVLQALEWRLLVVTTVDFADSILQILSSPDCPSSSTSTSSSCMCCTTSLSPTFPTIPIHLIHLLQQRVHEILQGVLLEVCFVGYEASLVAICAIQFVLEELMPIQSASLLHLIYEIFAPINMAKVKECYETMGDLVVDPLNINLCLSSSPDRVLQASTLIL